MSLCLPAPSCASIIRLLFGSFLSLISRSSLPAMAMPTRIHAACVSRLMPSHLSYLFSRPTTQVYSTNLTWSLICCCHSRDLRLPETEFQMQAPELSISEHDAVSQVWTGIQGGCGGFSGGCIRSSGQTGQKGGLMRLLLICLWNRVSPSLRSDLLYVVVMEKRPKLDPRSPAVTTEKVLQLTLISRMSVSSAPECLPLSGTDARSGSSRNTRIPVADVPSTVIKRGIRRTGLLIDRNLTSCSFRVNFCHR